MVNDLPCGYRGQASGHVATLPVLSMSAAFTQVGNGPRRAIGSDHYSGPERATVKGELGDHGELLSYFASGRFRVDTELRHVTSGSAGCWCAGSVIGSPHQLSPNETIQSGSASLPFQRPALTSP